MGFKCNSTLTENFIKNFLEIEEDFLYSKKLLEEYVFNNKKLR
jgi:hypothetical protein